MKRLLVLALFCVLSYIPFSSWAAESGWWWNPNESGRGLAVEVQGNTLFMAWYAYDKNTGESMWVSSGGIFDG